MKSEKNEIYILCPKKGNPRKNIDVCRQCRNRKKCKAYNGYMQPELPFIFSSEDLKMKEREHRCRAADFSSVNSNICQCLS